MFLVGPNTYFPLNAFSKNQTVVANSSTEVEVVPANHALRAERIPMLALMEQLGSRRFSRVLSSEVHGGQSGFNHVDEHWEFIDYQVCQQDPKYLL